jgi:hypothetical protein
MKLKTQKRTYEAMQLPGALALAAAGAATQANAAIVQITFANNYVANTGNGGIAHFTADLTGDGNDDLIAGISPNHAGLDSMVSSSRVAVAQIYNKPNGVASVWVNVGSSNITTNSNSLNLRGLAMMMFTDSGINAGALTYGFLDTTSIVTYPSGEYIHVNRLIFDDASTSAPTGVAYTDAAYSEWVAVPEPSSLGLLALGAGGLLTRRRRAAGAATKSA